jgi:hypothetical protein
LRALASSGSAAACLYVGFANLLGLGRGASIISGFSTRITRGPESLAGLGFSSIGPAGTTLVGLTGSTITILGAGGAGGAGGGVAATAGAAGSSTFTGAGSTGTGSTTAGLSIGAASGVGVSAIIGSSAFASSTAGVLWCWFDDFFLAFDAHFFQIDRRSGLTVVLCVPSLNHSRMVAASPAEMVDIWFFISSPSA